KLAQLLPVGPRGIDFFGFVEGLIEGKREKCVEGRVSRLDGGDARARDLLGRHVARGNGARDVGNGSRKPGGGAHSSTKPGTANPSWAVRGASASASAWGRHGTGSSLRRGKRSTCTCAVGGTSLVSSSASFCT